MGTVPINNVPANASLLQLITIASNATGISRDHLLLYRDYNELTPSGLARRPLADLDNLEVVVGQHGLLGARVKPERERRTSSRAGKGQRVTTFHHSEDMGPQLASSKPASHEIHEITASRLTPKGKNCQFQAHWVGYDASDPECDV